VLEDISLKSCIEFAVVTEEIGAGFYGRLSARFADNQEIANLFELLGNDEQVHKEQFSELLENLPEEEGVSPAPKQGEYLRAMSVSEFFTPGQGPFTDIDKIESRDDALEGAFRFEKATLGFYQAVQDVLGENATLTQVIETEKDHISRLMKVIVTGEKFRSLQDKWA
jgi:rubrerythrin